MKCCLCNKDIEVYGSWTKGHNAMPLKKGRCCDKCETKVLLKRISKIKKAGV